MDNAKGIKNTYNSIFKSKVPKIENIKMKKQINTNPTDSVNDSSKHTADSKYKSLTKNGHISKIVKQNQRFNNKLVIFSVYCLAMSLEQQIINFKFKIQLRYPFRKYSISIKA